LPIQQTIANLERLKTQAGRPIWIHVLPGANHSLRSRTGEQPDFWRVIGAWLEERGLI
jgi:hypothetical protein